MSVSVLSLSLSRNLLVTATERQQAIDLVRSYQTGEADPPMDEVWRAKTSMPLICTCNPPTPYRCTDTIVCIVLYCIVLYCIAYQSLLPAFIKIPVS
jgi:hypothetical protein